MSVGKFLKLFINSDDQEYDRFKRFSDSLLSRASKLSELITDLEMALEESKKPADSTEAKRVKQSSPEHMHVYGDQWVQPKKYAKVAKYVQ